MKRTKKKKKPFCTSKVLIVFLVVTDILDRAKTLLRLLFSVQAVKTFQSVAKPKQENQESKHSKFYFKIRTTLLICVQDNLKISSYFGT